MLPRSTTSPDASLYLVADVFHHAKMLRDVDIGDALFFLQFKHQVD